MTHWRWLCLTALVSVGCDNASSGDNKGWVLVQHGLPEALLGVWGSSSRDVWLVGSDVGAGPRIMRDTGSELQTVAAGVRGSLWDVVGSDASSPVYMVGDEGLVLRAERDGRVIPLEGMPDNVDLRAVALVDGELWVGGEQEGAGVVFQYRDGSFQRDLDIEGMGLGGGVTDIWASPEQGVWLVSETGDLLRHASNGWMRLEARSSEPLASVHGNAVIAVAVGGYVDGLALDLTPAGATDSTPADASQLNGVWVDDFGRVLAVGVRGRIYERRGSNWSKVFEYTGSLNDWSDVYVSPSGDVWVVGGYLQSLVPSKGMLLRYGAVTK